MPEGFKVLLFQKDHHYKGKDRYFLASEADITEVSARDVVQVRGTLVTHDYWLIAPAIHKGSGLLPERVVDLDDFSFLIEGKKLDRKKREQRNFLNSISDLCNQQVLKEYSEIHAGRKDVDFQIFGEIARAASTLWARLCLDAGFSGELDRCLNVEFPVLNYLMKCMMQGINLDIDALRGHRKTIEHDYYTALKRFAVHYNLPFEVPSDEAAKQYLENQGFDFSEVPLNYVLELLPTEFGIDLNELRRIADSRAVLWSLSFGSRIVQPIVDVFGSITSRVYLRDPAIQGLSKRHRDIIIPQKGRKLAYVDYGQFEVGIMAALSGDQAMINLFALDDLYVEVAKRLFGEAEHITMEKRKLAKRLFLSYAYGMSSRRLLDAASAQAIDRKRARDFFSSFAEYEDWKKKIQFVFEKSCRIGTSEGNFMTRDPREPLDDRGRRSAVSQVVQGTASLIFKKALLKLKTVSDIAIKIPLHDAVLFEYDAGFDINRVVSAMEEAMTEQLGGVVRGKAKIDQYFSAA